MTIEHKGWVITALQVGDYFRIIATKRTGYVKAYVQAVSAERAIAEFIVANL